MDTTWKTCFACDATYQGEVCGHCTAQANGWYATDDVEEAYDAYLEERMRMHEGYLDSLNLE